VFYVIINFKEKKGR